MKKGGRFTSQNYTIIYLYLIIKDSTQIIMRKFFPMKAANFVFCIAHRILVRYIYPFSKNSQSL
jgi:hypothetical protein